MVGELIGESIKSAIALKIRSSFATTSGQPPVTTYPLIYKEKMVQEMTTPCFFIWTMDESQRQIMNNVYERDFQMNVRYHPSEADLKAYETLTGVGHKLLEELLLIDVPIWLGRYTTVEPIVPIEEKLPVPGKQMSFQIVDNVLQVYVSYKVKIKQVQQTVPGMETLEINQI